MKNYLLVEMLVASALLAGVCFENEQRKLGEAQKKLKELVQKADSSNRYARRADALAQEVLEEKRTLADAVAELVKVREQTGHDPLPYLQAFYYFTDLESCLACQLCQRIFDSLENESATGRLAHYQSLHCQFSAFQSEFPTMFQHSIDLQN